jgi:hypothetical protein
LLKESAEGNNDRPRVRGILLQPWDGAKYRETVTEQIEGWPWEQYRAHVAQDGEVTIDLMGAMPPPSKDTGMTQQEADARLVYQTTIFGIARQKGFVTEFPRGDLLWTKFKQPRNPNF